MKNQICRFTEGSRYWSDDKFEMFVENRNNSKGKIKLFIGFGRPAWYKVRVNGLGREEVTVKGHRFEAIY